MEKLTRNSLFIKNWHPLTDYKIFTKILANRLQLVLPYLIHSDQKGFMKNRHITDNLTELLSIIEFCNIMQQRAIIMAVDFKKAFDTINWQALIVILEKFNFPQHFINMIMTCFKDFCVSILNNGYTTDQLKFEQGTKQGCPISSLIFNLVVEIIGIKICQSKEVQGINISGCKKLLGQYVDDLWTATKYQRDSFNAQIRIFHEYQLVTGLAINYNKTEIMCVGSLQKSDAELYSGLPLKWSDGPITILGLSIFQHI